jgi:hypothetical protein
MQLLLAAHSGFRYIVLLAALAGLIQAVVAGRRGYDRAGLAMLRVYVVVLDIQLMLGILVLLTHRFVPALVGHLVLMLGAIAIAHVARVRLGRRLGEAGVYRVQLGVFALTLVMIAAGIVAIGRRVV